MKPVVSIIFVNYNSKEQLSAAIATVRRAVRNISYEIIAVDNASLKKIPSRLHRNLKVRIIENAENVGYGRALNIGSRHATGKYLLLSNPDILFFAGSIYEMVKRMERDSNIGILGPQMRNKRGKILPTISGKPLLPDVLFAFSYLNKLLPNNVFSKRYWLPDRNRDEEHVVDTISGACMLIRKILFKKLKGFDERFYLYFEEADLCLRVQKAGKKVLYYPKAKITHIVGASTSDKTWIRRQYQKSRFQFLKKYHGLLTALIGEGMLRMVHTSKIFLATVLLISLFMNLYSVSTLMMFIGDFGRDYLAARDMLLTGNIPLVGIPSSVIWLHQGPLSIYFIALSLFIGKFHPVAPAVFYGVVGVASTYLVYRLGAEYFNTKVGLLAALFYATSPLVVVSVRMPYHTSSIPFFACLFFLLLYKVLQGRTHLLFITFFLLGLLFQLELSNGVLFFVLAILGLLYRRRLKRADVVRGALGFSLGILPFILYDLTHGLNQTVGFALWVANRIRLFFGLTLSGHSTTVHAPGALQTIWEQIIRAVFPASPFFTAILLCILLVVLFKQRKEVFSEKKISSLTLILLWAAIPLFGFFIHAAPGTAYFPLVFPPVAILIGFTFYRLMEEIKVSIFLFITIISINAFFTIRHAYFLETQHLSGATVPGWSYGLGSSLSEQMKLINFIVSDADQRAFQLKGGGFLSQFQSSIDNYKYLVLWKGARLSSDAPLVYIIYADKREIPKKNKVVFSNNFHRIVKYEKR